MKRLAPNSERVGWLLGIALLTIPFISISAQTPSTATNFSGKYADLKPEQKRLVDDWCQRLGKTIHKDVDPAELYANLAISQRTTFGGITHALLTATLTDDTGASLGPAIQIIDRVDRLAGKISGAPGDEQFRIYVQLKPNAIDVLSKSREFSREPDNTVYHKGYPTCFRSQPVAPSIQVSIDKEGRNADIDVDYRSSKFPAALVNGHLRASNSDVRAGNNDQRHNQRWDGLLNWWASLLGLMVSKSDFDAEGTILPKAPKVTDKARPEEAVEDFLSSWLIDKRPEYATAYLTPDAYLCMEVEQGRRVDRGMARFEILKGLQAIKQKFGNVSTLSQAATGVTLTDERVKVISQPHESEFTLYDVREDLAERFNCRNKLEGDADVLSKAAQSKEFGKYVGSVFRLTPSGEKGEAVAMLWARTDGYWKVISYDIEPEFNKQRSPDLRAAPPSAKSLPEVAGDAEMIRAAEEFMKDWFVQNNVDKAIQFVSPQCYPCVSLYRPDDKPAPKADAEARAMLRNGMAELAAETGKVRSLDSAVIAASPQHPELKLVRHQEEKAFVLVSIPDEMAATVECASRGRKTKAQLSKPSRETVYGNFYALGFSLAQDPEKPAVFWAVWGREGGRWKIVSYLVFAS